MVRLKLFEFLLSPIYKSLINLFRSEPVLKKILIVGLGNPGIEYENTREREGPVAADAMSGLSCCRKI